MTDKEALKLALEALEPFGTPRWAGTGVDKANEAITAINQALAAPAQRPQNCGTGYCSCIECVVDTPLAPQRTWVDLTPQDLNEIFKVSTTGEDAVFLALDKIKELNYD